MTKILLTGGGSGGHIYPLLAVAENLKKTAEDIELFYLGPANPLNDEFKKLDIKVYTLASSKLRRYFSLANFLDIPKFILSIFQAMFRLYFLMPDIVFSKGGPGSFAVILAARFYFIPVVIHESDSIASLTNRLSAGLAKKIVISFENTTSYFPKKKTKLTGNPIREELLEKLPEQNKAKTELGFNPEEPLVLIFGGSQGARRIDNFVLENLETLLAATQIYHLTGTNKLEETKQTSSAILGGLGDNLRKRYLLAGRLRTDEIKIAMNAADLIISRAGAGAIYEIAAFQKPSILIPLSGSANNHQKNNAYEYAKKGATCVIEEENFKISIVLMQIKNILKDENLMQKMKEAAQKFSKTEAAAVIAKEILELIPKK